MYTTACEGCRKARIKCVREQRGQDQAEVCDRCRSTGLTCVTVKRRVGRQPGVKNKKKRKLPGTDQDEEESEVNGRSSKEVDHVPNALHALAAAAMRGEGSSTKRLSSSAPPDTPILRDISQILKRYDEWIPRIDGTSGQAILARNLDALRSLETDTVEGEEPDLFSGRIDLARPDACPEDDVISLQIVTLEEANHLYDRFMTLITNGAMYFDPSLHTLTYIRSRSSFLLAAILAFASTYSNICSSPRLHAQLMAHAHRLERLVYRHHYKSIEIIQALCLFSSWSEVPSVLSRDKTWMYISHAIALAIELRLDTSTPYCVLSDPLYKEDTHDMLVRNAHRAWLLLFIHDRNMAMVAGRYPLVPESSLTSKGNLDQWGKLEGATSWDAPICASVSLRRLFTELGHNGSADFVKQKALIDRSMSHWRRKWASEISLTHEYDIIARFATFILALTSLRRTQHAGKDDAEARSACETYAFEVVCSSISHYKSWKGLLNSATFDTSMVAFCAIYTLQSLDRPSDWTFFRLATLLELVIELEKQAVARYSGNEEDMLSVVDAMARQLSRGIRSAVARISQQQVPVPQQQSQQTFDFVHQLEQPEPLLSQDDLTVTQEAIDLPWTLPVNPNGTTWDEGLGAELTAVPLFDINQIGNLLFGDEVISGDRLDWTIFGTGQTN